MIKKEPLSRVWIQAILFGIFFPFILSIFLDQIGNLFDFDKIFGMMASGPGVYLAGILNKNNLLPLLSDAGDAGISIFFLYALLINVIFYFFSYLLFYYYIRKRTIKKAK